MEVAINSTFSCLIRQRRKVLKIGNDVNMGRVAYWEFVTFLFWEYREVLVILGICDSLIQER